MSASIHPGTYIRPVGRYQYCYEVVRILPRDQEGEEQWWCKRWGLGPDRQPMDDGRGHGIHYLNGLKPVADGVWKDEWKHATPRWTCCPLYYRRIDVRGQMSLF